MKGISRGAFFFIVFAILVGFGANANADDCQSSIVQNSDGSINLTVNGVSISPGVIASASGRLYVRQDGLFGWSVTSADAGPGTCDSGSSFQNGLLQIGNINLGGTPIWLRGAYISNTDFIITSWGPGATPPPVPNTVNTATLSASVDASSPDYSVIHLTGSISSNIGQPGGMTVYIALQGPEMHNVTAVTDAQGVFTVSITVYNVGYYTATVMGLAGPNIVYDPRKDVHDSLQFYVN